MAFADVAAKVVQGFAGAAGNLPAQSEVAAWQADRQNKIQDEQQRNTAPYSMAIKGLTDKLSTIDKDKDPQAYNDTVDQIQQNIHSIREIFHPDAKLGAGDWLKTHTTDRMHITNHDDRVKELAAQNQGGVAQDASQAHAVAEGAPQDAWNKYASLYQRVTGEAPSDDVKKQWAEKQGGILSTVKPNLKNFRMADGSTRTFDTSHPETIPQDAVLVQGSQSSDLKPLVVGGVPVGVPHNGRMYLPSDMAKADTPAEVKEVWNNQNAGMKAAAESKEKIRREGFAEREKLQRNAIAAANTRAMFNFQNQLSMAGARPAQGLLQKQEQQVYADQALQKKMQDLLPEAIAGNQQAQLAILANHIAMTTHQPGASMRPTKALFDEATASAPWLQNIEKQVGPDGILQGVKLSPDQLQNMVELAPVTLNADTQTLNQMRSDLEGTLAPTPAQVKPPAGPKTQKLKSAATQGGGTVRMRAPDGSISPVPRDQVEYYKAKGATVVQ